MNYLGIRFPLPKPKPEAAVDRRELTVTTNGAAKKMMLSGEALVSDEIIFAETDNYTACLVDIDAHGNRSLPSVDMHGSIAEDARPPQPDPIGPLIATSKRFLTEEEAEIAKEESIRKAKEHAKADAIKAEANAARAETDAASAQQFAKARQAAPKAP